MSTRRRRVLPGTTRRCAQPERRGAFSLELGAGRLVMLDIGIPKLDGRDVLRQLKDRPRTAGIPGLVVTAFGGDQNLRHLLLEFGAVDVLEKPVDLALPFNKAERVAGTRE